MRARPVPATPVLIASLASMLGCQLLYEKNDLAVSTGGSGGTSTTATAGGGGSGGATSSSTASTGGGGSTTTSTGGGGSTTTSMGGGGTMTTSTGGGGAGGTTSTGGGGTGGTGGTTTTTSSTTMDCSGERLFVLGTSATSVLCATFAPMSAQWSSTVSTAAHSLARPAVGMIDAQTGVGVLYEEVGVTGKGPLRAVELANGQCGAPANVLSVVTKAAPSTAVVGATVQALFQGAEGAGTDHPFSTGWSLGLWSAPDDIDMNVFSPTIAGLAASDADMLAVYGGGDDNLYRVRSASGAWQPPATAFKNAAAMNEQTNKALTPAASGIGPGSWLVVFQEKMAPTQLRWLTGDAAANTPSQQIPTALSPSSVALARTESGAVLAFRGTDDNVYAALYTAAGDTWGPIAQVPGATTQTSPAVSAGVCTHQAELVYADAAGVVKHSSLEGGVWSAPVAVDAAATAMKGVALASSP